MVNQWRISYERDKILGCGSYGIVCLGKLLTEDEIDEMPVAVKRVWIQKNHLLLLQKLSTKSEEDRELAHQLKLGQHPNVVKLLHWED